MSICTGTHMAQLMDEQIAWEPDCFHCGDKGYYPYMSDDPEFKNAIVFCECVAGDTLLYESNNPIHTCALPPGRYEDPDVPF